MPSFSEDNEQAGVPDESAVGFVGGVSLHIDLGDDGQSSERTLKRFVSSNKQKGGKPKVHSFEVHRGMRVRAIRPPHSTTSVPYLGQEGVVTTYFTHDGEHWAEIRLDNKKVTNYRLVELIAA